MIMKLAVVFLPTKQNYCLVSIEIQILDSFLYY